jgi:predicted porin
MNKKLVTLAVAAAMAAPAAAMADATLYGKAHVSIDYADIEDGYKGWGLSGGNEIPGSGRASRLGVKGSEDLGGGLKAIYQIEFGINMVDKNYAVADNKETVSMRNSFVGLAGGWGTFLVGRHDTPLKISTGKLDLFSDTMADYNGTVGFQDLRADNAIAYISPSFSGFQFAGAVVPTGGGTATGVYNEDADSLAEAYSLAGIYKNGPFYASVAYESLGDNLFAAEVTDPVTEITSVVTPGDDDNKWRIGLGLLDWNGFTLTGIYEDRSNVGGVDDLDQQLWQIQAAYAFGNNTIKGMYGSADRDGNDYEVLGYEFDIDGDKNTWAIGFDHNFSKRTKAYVLYTDVDDDEAVFGDSWSGFSMGMIHSF